MGSIAKLAIFMLACLTACGQMHKHWLIAPNPLSLGQGGLPHGIQFRWIATNLIAGVTNGPVTNWTDIVSGSSWTNSANFPKWTNGLGVYFDGTTFLYTTNVVINSQHAYLMVIKPDSTAAFQGIFGHIVNSTTFGIDTGPVKWYDTAGGFGKPVSGNKYDIFYSANNIGDVLPIGPYTNGVWSGVGAGHSWDGVTLNKVGTGSGANYTGTIYELIIWSNAQTFTYTELTNIHTYCTNTYKYSP